MHFRQGLSEAAADSFTWIRKSKSKTTATTQSHTCRWPQIYYALGLFRANRSALLSSLLHQPLLPHFLLLLPACHRIELGRRYSVTHGGNITGLTSLERFPRSLTVSRGGKSNQYQKVALRPSRMHTLNTGSGHTAQLTQAHPKGDHLQPSTRWHGSLCLHPPRRDTIGNPPQNARHIPESRH